MVNVPWHLMIEMSRAEARKKTKINIGLSKDLAAEFGGKPSDFLKTFNKVTKAKLGIADALRRKRKAVETVSKIQSYKPNNKSSLVRANVPQFSRAA